MQNLPEIDIDTEYDTYDGLSRVVSVMGFPLVPSILIFFCFFIHHDVRHAFLRTESIGHPVVDGTFAVVPEDHDGS